MHATHFASLLRAVATTPSRRAVARALTGVALAGALNPLFGLTEVDAKRNKKKKRRRKKKQRKKEQPFCAGMNVCIDGANARCGDGEFNTGCYCHVTARGETFCTYGTGAPDCEACAEGEVCVEDCDGGLVCGWPCPDPY